ncbi:hypothetical protein F5890DRAFT_1517346 [Lentinula detonsa]|uniref:Protein kinase domain-containing protein n=1 Tax=Lentinula detonsa TaxID=2804962 RepID=A0AA38PZE9_9AGAR|nr:hypothetical protein F5890DRAFT_1517346 [Lentinula detonsa]
MRFCTTSLKCVFVILWLLKFVAAGAIVSSLSKSKPPPESSTKSAARQEWEKHWWKQIKDTPWINYQKGQCEGMNENNQVYNDKEDLTDKLTRRTQITDHPAYRGRVFTVPLDVQFTGQHGPVSGDKTVVKLVDLKQVTASCEVAALQKYTSMFVTSGFTMEDNVKKGVIVSLRVPGEPLHTTQEWKEQLRIGGYSDAGQIPKMIDQLAKKVRVYVYNELIMKHKIVHVDLTSLNLPVSANGEFTLIDFGYPSIFPVQRVPTRKEFDAWFEPRWRHLWSFYLPPKATSRKKQAQATHRTRDMKRRLPRRRES